MTAKHKASLVLDIIKGNTTVAQAARDYDLTIIGVADAMAGMENQLKARPKDIAPTVRIRD
ncbi:hypothetical protein [Desulforamulus ruminis]|uniref:hypothetical protein n=1 Tax=Desulforamulus ruminis TaxID=1564 RepID=UPI0003132CF0|nr:hypothetical protein [Desulforamulus ruminis]